MNLLDSLRERITAPVCIYCGDLADSDEHFPPRSVGSTGLILSACRECNSFAGNHHPYDFKERFAYVKTKLTRRYRYILQYHAFSDAELDRFDGTLKREVSTCTKERLKISKRLAWSVDDYFALIDLHSASVLRSVASPTTTESEKPSSTPTSEAPSKNVISGGGDEVGARETNQCLDCGFAFYKKRNRKYSFLCSPHCKRYYLIALKAAS